MIAPSFPLLRLPNKALIKTTQQIKPPEQLVIFINFFSHFVIKFRIVLSFLSQRAKRLVMKTLRSIKDLEVCVENSISIRVEFRNWPRLEFKFKSYTTFEDCEGKLSKIGLRASIDHFMDIANRRKLTRIGVYNSNIQFSKKFIHRIFGGLHTFALSCSASFTSLEMVSALESIDKLIFHTRKRRERLDTTMLRNRDIVYAPGVKITLNELLFMNVSMFVQFSSVYLENKETNSFLKHWIYGSNRSLEYFSMQCDTSLNELILFDGLEYEELSSRMVTRYRYKFHPESSFYETASICGGFSILRYDGARATVQLKKFTAYSKIRMIVWH